MPVPSARDAPGGFFGAHLSLFRGREMHNSAPAHTFRKQRNRLPLANVHHMFAQDLSQ
jgi:hypothetical protein